MDAAWFTPVIDECGWIGILKADAMPAMRSASVMPPHFDRSGCQMVMTPSSSTRVNSYRVKWFSPAASGVKPEKPGVVGMYLAGRWYRLEIDPALIPAADPVRRLDVSLLSDQLLAPILGIGDLRRDKRIDFVGGIRGREELERRVDSGEMAVAFALYPVSMQQLMDIADTGNIMPPKTTWFEPKLRSGLVIHKLK